MRQMSRTTRIRVISGLVAIVGILAIIFFSGYIGIAIATFFVSALALFEYGRMTLDGDRYKIARYYFLLLGLVAFVTSIVRNDWLLHSFVLSTLLLFILFLLMAKDESVPLEELVNKAGLSLLGILYAGVCPVYICLTARLSSHLEWFIFALCVVFSGDVVAYFVGRSFGKTRLFTRISPNKSVEGAIGSLFASVLVGLALRHFLLPDTDLFLITALSILTSCVAQLGDLCESFVKRSFHTKDSGSIMPGHGGILDRVDGILFGAPIVYIFAKYVILN
jgi:phosphatidate cytidylyltransferase